MPKGRQDLPIGAGQQGTLPRGEQDTQDTLPKGNPAKRHWKTWEELLEERKKDTYKKPKNVYYNNKYKPAGAGTVSDARREKVRAKAIAKKKAEEEKARQEAEEEEKKEDTLAKGASASSDVREPEPGSSESQNPAPRKMAKQEQEEATLPKGAQRNKQASKRQNEAERIWAKKGPPKNGEEKEPCQKVLAPTKKQKKQEEEKSKPCKNVLAPAEDPKMKEDEKSQPCKTVVRLGKFKEGASSSGQATSSGQASSFGSPHFYKHAPVLKTQRVAIDWHNSNC